MARPSHPSTPPVNVAGDPRLENAGSLAPGDDDIAAKEKLWEKRESRVNIGYLVCLALGIALPILAVSVLGPWAASVRVPRFFGVLAAMLGGVGLALAPVFKARLRFIENQLFDIEFEKDILKFGLRKEETRADKLLRMNQHQLRRYHELNLRQSAWVFAIGLFCILLGVVIIGITLHMVQNGKDSQEKIVLAVIGGIGSVLTNFIGAIYLQMHAAASKSLSSFHSTLVATQQIFMANLIASHIMPDEKRFETLARLSLTMMGKSDGSLAAKDKVEGPAENIGSSKGTSGGTPEHKS